MTDYNTKWGGSIKTIDATSDAGKKMQADVEAENYVYGKIPESDFYTCIDKANDAAYVLLRIGEGAKQEIGCSCDYFKKERKTCEHLYALRDIDVSKLDASPNWLVGFLQVDNNWHVDDNNRLVPPSTGSEKVVPEDPPKKEEKPVMVRTDCPHCDWWVSLPKHDADKALENHLKTCEKNPANAASAISPDPEIDIGVDVADDSPEFKLGEAMSAVAGAVGDIIDTVASDKPKKQPSKKPETKQKPAPKSATIFDSIEDLIEFGVGQIFGDTGTGKTAFCRAIAEQAADAGKKVVYWDSEGNMTRKQRASMNEHKNIKYVLDRDWHHIKNMLNDDLSKGAYKIGKCDLFILDSIGVPVLGIYGTMKQNQKGEALQGMQGLLYNLTVWAEANSAVVIVTNQPVSEMNKTKEQIADRHPFGDKAMFFTKEILKIVIGERNEYKTVCHLLAWRSRSRGRGAMLGKVTISDKGTEIEFGG